MSGRFILSPRADQDIEEISAFIARDSLDIALRFMDAVWSTFDRLARSPHLGRPRETGDSELEELRSLSVDDFPPFLIFYLAIPDGVRILRVMHGARDVENCLADGV